jgi:hypothetical protein
MFGEAAPFALTIMAFSALFVGLLLARETERTEQPEAVAR